LTDPVAIRHRIEAWHRTGNVYALWPDVSPTERRLSNIQILTVTVDMLRGAATEPTLFLETERECSALGAAAYMSGMGPLLGWWIEQGMVKASEPAQRILALHLEHGRRRIANIWAATRPILTALRALGVFPILLKGLHTGARYFPEPGTRPAGDVDLLVRPTEGPLAATALNQAGLREARRTLFGGRSEWVPADGSQEVRSLMFDHADNPWGIDLHTALERWYFRGQRAGFGEEAFANTDDLDLGPDSVRVLGQPHLTAFLALHASYELVKMRLIRLFELVQVVRHDQASGTLRWTELTTLLEQTGTLRFAYPALALAERLGNGTLERALIERGERNLPTRARRVLDSVEREGMAALSRRSLDDRLMWARGWKELLLNLSELAWPSDDGVSLGVGRLYVRRLRALARGTVDLRAR